MLKKYLFDLINDPNVCDIQIIVSRNDEKPHGN